METKQNGCSICDKTFKMVSNLKDHMESVHEKLRPFPCDVCGKMFPTAQVYKIHNRTHTGERPYSCSECGKLFKSQGEMSKHKKMHQDVTPYACSMCGKTFKVATLRNVHFQSIHGQKVFSCSFCHKTFGHRKSLRHLLPRAARVGAETEAFTSEASQGNAQGSHPHPDQDRLRGHRDEPNSMA